MIIHPAAKRELKIIPQAGHLIGTSLLPVVGQTLPKAARVPEAEVKAKLRPILYDWFKYREEVTGHTPKGTAVKLDFWCYPLARTVELGWPERWFGIEAKGYGLQDQRKKTAARLVHQAMVYRQSTFPADGELVQPDMVLIYPSLATILKDDEHTVGDDPMFRDGYIFGLAKLAAMNRVGELATPIHGRFEVYFHGINCWFRSTTGRSRIDCLGAEDDHASR